MIIKNLSIKNFRNYEDLNIDFNCKKNIFIGNNAQGKTNILEAIYLLAITKSYRINIDKSLIKDEKLFSKIKGIVEKDNEQILLDILINDKGKSVKKNNIVIKKISEYISNLMVIVFSPDDLEIVKGSPNIRRRFLNIEIGQINNKYLNALGEYNRLLKTRNEYLKNKKFEDIDFNYFEIINNQLSDKAAIIYQTRYQFLNKINPISNRIYMDIFKSGELSLEYKPNIDIDNFEIEKIKKIYLEKLNNNIKRDLLLKTTTYGPHRDDFVFLIDNKQIRDYGSQGQHRIAILCMKLAEIEIFKEVTKEYPILLLDDIFSELDENKKNSLIKYVDNLAQIFITTTDLNSINFELLKDSKIFNVENGKITH